MGDGQVASSRRGESPQIAGSEAILPVGETSQLESFSWLSLVPEPHSALSQLTNKASQCSVFLGRCIHHRDE